MTSLTFDQAIAATQKLLDDISTHTLSVADLQTPISELVATETGARGFFVTTLGDRRLTALFDPPAESMLAALRSSAEIVSELLIKNLAMSSAMALYHRRNQDEETAAGSDLVRSRTLDLIGKLQLPQIPAKAKLLRDSAQTGTGAYTAFLNRWGYDQEQLQIIGQTFAEIVS
jgi:hypothetical protein